jgi:hypothetical protein
MSGVWTANIVTIAFMISILTAIALHKNDSNKGNPPGGNDQ